MPILLRAFARLESRPDVVMLDGQGFAHPRRIGLAPHLGLWLGMPTFGCAKTRLVGEHDEPGLDAGDFAVLTDKGETIGHVLRTKPKAKPLYISAGHRIDLA